MAKIDRRRFLQWGVSGAALALLSRCLPDSTTPAPPVGTEEAAVVAPTATPQLLRSSNRPGFYIRYYNPFPPVDTETWQLSVEGLVRRTRKLSLEDVKAFPLAEQTSRMKCVEGWSVAAKWVGFRPQALVDLVEPQNSAKWVHFHSADGYYESLSLAELLLDRVIFVYNMNDAPLLPEYGAPLRLIVPFKYAYKGPKALTRVVFAKEDLRGYWPTVGPYSTEGDIQPGRDYALDLDERRRVEGRGEIIYEDGPESQGQ